MLVGRVPGVLRGRQHVLAVDVARAASASLDDVANVRAEVVRVGEALLVRVGHGHGRERNFFRLPVEDDVEVVDAGLDGLVAGERRELVAAEVGSRRGRVLLLRPPQLGGFC